MNDLLSRDEAERLLRLVPDLDMEHPFVGELLDGIAALRAEVERLDGIIDDAPHEDWCRCICGPEHEEWIDETKGCDCFKSKAAPARVRP